MLIRASSKPRVPPMKSIQGINDPLMVFKTLNFVVFFTLLSDKPNKQRPPGMARVLLKLSAIKEALIPLDPQESS
ncbi:hypothetical protein [Pseudomonas sp. CLCA07]|jgi:hypothetical protein